jgi:UDP-N-acetylglucosamine--N-acetylmuramyl-(pentapeptide) pyrophosphoryl-undecaprenol N-acetylglucosamine transferase
MMERSNKPYVAIACGGTGGHLFPGMAVGEVLRALGCDVALIISPKEIDQQGVKSAAGMEVITMPAVGLERGNIFRFLHGFWRSYRMARAHFKKRPPQVMLGMGGFTSAPPVLAAGLADAKTFLHDSNAVPGRANRWLAPWVDEVFVGFQAAAGRLCCARVIEVGTPVRPQFRPLDPATCRLALGLDAERPTLLIMGGSQGARGVNELAVCSLPLFMQRLPDLQFLHLTGSGDFEKTTALYRDLKLRAVVRAFLPEMEQALGAATLAVSRAGASSLAEFAAMGVPSILIPLPSAADNHQFFNAKAYAETGAAHLLEQASAMPEGFVQLVLGLLKDQEARSRMSRAILSWHQPGAAERIAGRILAAFPEFSETGIRQERTSSIGSTELQMGSAPTPRPSMQLASTRPDYTSA